MKKKTHEQFISELLTKNKKLVLCDGEQYNGSCTKLKFKCQYKHIVEVRPKDVLRGHGCYKCRKKPTKTHERFMQELDVFININLKKHQIYKNAKTKLIFICDKGHEWSARPANILSGYGCPKCVNKNVTIDELIQRLKNKNNQLTLVQGQQYVNNYTCMNFMVMLFMEIQKCFYQTINVIHLIRK